MNFYVGQRVKLTRPMRREFIGDTGTIIALFDETPSPSYPINCDVCWDQKPPPRVSTRTHTERLEPILPLGMESIAAALALWQPEQVAA